jgi:hypothetical protein
MLQAAENETCTGTYSIFSTRRLQFLPKPDSFVLEHEVCEIACNYFTNEYNINKREIMEIKINRKKWEKINSGMENILDRNILENNYNIIIREDKNKWVQLFQENNKLSLVFCDSRKIYTIYSLANTYDKIVEVINSYIANKKIKLRWDEVKDFDHKQRPIIIIWIIFILNFIVLWISLKYNLPEIIFTCSVILLGITMAAIGGYFDEKYSSIKDSRIIYVVGGIIIAIIGFIKTINILR